MAKTKINKKVLNAIIKKMGEKQNKVKKLNAGQLRESASLFIESLVELSLEDKALLINSMTAK